MSRSRKRFPMWSCPRGRAKCWCCSRPGLLRFKVCRATGDKSRQPEAANITALEFAALDWLLERRKLRGYDEQEEPCCPEELDAA